MRNNKKKTIVRARKDICCSSRFSAIFLMTKGDFTRCSTLALNDQSNSFFSFCSYLSSRASCERSFTKEHFCHWTWMFRKCSWTLLFWRRSVDQPACIPRAGFWRCPNGDGGMMLPRSHNTEGAATYLIPNAHHQPLGSGDEMEWKYCSNAFDRDGSSIGMHVWVVYITYIEWIWKRLKQKSTPAAVTGLMRIAEWTTSNRHHPLLMGHQSP